MKILLIIMGALTLFSCEKDNKPPAKTGSIQYKVNGTLISIDNANSANGEKVVFEKQIKGVLPKTRYLLDVDKGSATIVESAIIADSIHEITYHYDSVYTAENFGVFALTLNTNGSISALRFGSDYLDIDITSYKNGRISGTFSAKLSELTGSFSDYLNRGSVLVTEGVLNNVPVLY